MDLGSDVLFGGNGSDRFLDLSGDDRRDFASNDALLEFRSGNASWTQREIEVIDEGFRKLHFRTGSTRVLKGTLDDSPLTFIKQQQSGNGGELGRNRLQNSFSFNPDTGQVLSQEFTRTIEIGDWNESNEAENELHVETVIHEIAHNWDSALEINEVFSGQGAIWSQYIAQSGWRTTPASGFTQGSDTTSEPFDQVFNASTGTFTQVVDTWYYRTGISFARDYGNSNPKEDWSTIWEAALSDDAADRAGVGNKVDVVDRLFDLL